MHNLRIKVTLLEDCVEHVRSTDFPGNYPGFDDSWSFRKFQKDFRIIIDDITYEVKQVGGIEVDVSDEIVFQMIGVDASIANAIRRIMLVEIPVMAVEKVCVRNNTSVMQDEVLAHRLGLIPIGAMANEFEYRDANSALHGTEHDTLEFVLRVRCRKNPHCCDAQVNDSDHIYVDDRITTRYLEWVPRGSQRQRLSGPIGPAFNNILLTRLIPGQELDLQLFCVKGIAKDHAKFSAVATASYRLMPHITLLKPVRGKLADALQSCFTPGVIGVCESSDGDKEAYVADSSRDTLAREALQHPMIKDCVKIECVRDHFIFSVESAGQMRPENVLMQAFSVLEDKCTKILSQLENEAAQVKF